MLWFFYFILFFSLKDFKFINLNFPHIPQNASMSCCIIIAPSSTSFFNADSTEELPRLGHATSASCFENFPSVFSEYVFTTSYALLFFPVFSANTILVSFDQHFAKLHNIFPTPFSQTSLLSPNNSIFLGDNQMCWDNNIIVLFLIPSATALPLPQVFSCTYAPLNLKLILFNF